MCCDNLSTVGELDTKIEWRQTVFTTSDSSVDRLGVDLGTQGSDRWCEEPLTDRTAAAIALGRHERTGSLASVGREKLSCGNGWKNHDVLSGEKAGLSDGVARQP